MIHTKRTWREPYTLADLETLAELLCTRSWSLCTAFRVGNLTLLNDSSTECAEPEFAVLRDERLVDSIVIGRFRDSRRLASYLRCLTWLVPAPSQAPLAVGTPRSGAVARLYHDKSTPCCLCDPWRVDPPAAQVRIA